MIAKKQTFKMGRAEFRFDPALPYIVVKLGKNMTHIKKTELWMMTFAISKEADQPDLIPAQKKEMMSFDRVHTIKATKAIAEGETIKFHCHTDVPIQILNSLVNKESWEECKKALQEAQALIPTPVSGQIAEKSVQ